MQELFIQAIDSGSIRETTLNFEGMMLDKERLFQYNIENITLFIFTLKIDSQEEEKWVR